MTTHDLAGQRFGCWVVLRRDGRIGKNVAWLCVSDDGEIRRRRADKLRKGDTRSFNRPPRKPKNPGPRKPRVVDRTGQRFGRLVALYCDGRQRGRATWTLRCDCGGTASRVSVKNLRGGHTRSCGCLQREQRQKNLGHEGKPIHGLSLARRNIGHGVQCCGAATIPRTRIIDYMEHAESQ
jgi:hypothetical protein